MNLLSKRQLDFEEKNSYSFPYRSDSEKNTMGTLEISIDDVNEAPVLVVKPI